MSKIVSRKLWVQVDHDELKELIRASLPHPPDGLFEVIEVQVKLDGHRVSSVTIGISLKEAPDA